MRALVIDLRGNGGGLLQASIEAAELFLDRGATIVKTKGRESPERTFKVRDDPPYPKDELPLIVLVNKSSASASEILAAAIRDPLNRRGLVVGGRTFGKGSVQKLYDVRLGRDPEDSRKMLTGWLKLTTEKYYTPSGESIQREKDAETWGVQPDIVVEMSEAEVVNLRRQWEKDRVAEQLPEAASSGQRRRPDREGAGIVEEAEENGRAPDPPLERAVEILRALLILSPPAGVPEKMPEEAPLEVPVPATE